MSKIMSISKDTLLTAHRRSYANKTRLKSASRCGCFYCLKIFTPDQIVDWCVDEPDETAICPYCGIDAVLGDNEGVPLTEDLLQAMYDEWFGESSEEEGRRNDG